MKRIRVVAVALAVVAIVGTCAHAAPAVPTAADPTGAPNTVPPLVGLPADERAHPEFANEWWYTVGHLDTETGPSYGFEVGLYRFAVDGGVVYRADIAITDVNANSFHSSMTFPEATISQSERLDVSIGTASLTGSSDTDMRVIARIDDQTELNLGLRSRRPPLPARAQGFIPFGNGSTYYYSLTNLAVDGLVRVGGVQQEATGRAWQDHQWGNFTWDSITGWTAMAIQLDGNVQLSVANGKGPRPSSTVLTRDRHVRVSDTATITPIGKWQSPRTGMTYDSGWIVRDRERGVRLLVLPVVEDQELPMPDRGPVFGYWEGKAVVSGTYNTRPVSGSAYVELLVPVGGGGSEPPAEGDGTGDLRDLT